MTCECACVHGNKTFIWTAQCSLSLRDTHTHTHPDPNKPTVPALLLSPAPRVPVLCPSSRHRFLLVPDQRGYLWMAGGSSHSAGPLCGDLGWALGPGGREGSQEWPGSCCCTKGRVVPLPSVQDKCGGADCEGCFCANTYPHPFELLSLCFSAADSSRVTFLV